VNKLKIDWLIETSETGTAAPSTPELQHVEYPFPPEIGVGSYRQLLLEKDIKVFQASHHLTSEAAKTMTQIAKFNSCLSEPSLVIQSVHEGSIHHLEKHPLCNISFKPGHYCPVKR